MDLKIFKEQSLFEAMKSFFQDLNVPISEVTEDPANPEDIVSNYFNENNGAHALIDTVYFLGMVNEKAFDGEENSDSLKSIKASKEDYDGLLIFGIQLKNRANGLKPTRSQLAEITRLFNREYNYTPVTLIFKYDEQIAFANSERLKYRQEWREGEKVGKISLLKDIDIENTHRGHLSILEQLKVPRTGRNAVLSFSQLYYYWQSVFSISVLNKNFYEEVIKWFNKAINDIRIPSEAAGSEKHKDFAVRLIARLIFIWFLKELRVVKDELLIPEFNNGDENDLIKPKKAGTSYYKFILQNLFFNALNAEQPERDTELFDVYKSDYSNIEELKENIFFSPYLNGGLFDVHPNDWCEDGKVNNAFVVPDHLFLDKETGINSILSRYKFTIAENTPLEEEIAVDPEMLGRIFENLLAEQSDDTKEAARKNAGAFYTPRPVVSYMCRNTLLKHLDTEIKPENGKQIIHKILDTTVFDPACGSGAFPMGMLEEMMQVLETVDPEGNLWVSEMLKSHDDEFKEHIADFIADKQIRYVKKLGLLRNCLFGIDLLEYAVEITKLRCWLSLIVEQKVDFTKPNYNLKPLPNLEFKFYKKNSLFRKYKDENLNQLIDSIDKASLLEELVNLENEYFIAKSSKHGNKEEIKQKIIALLEKLVDSQSDKIQKEFNSAQGKVNHLVSSRAPEREITKAKKKVKELANELAELAVFRNTIKDYFIERVVFPGIFNKKNPNPGFDIVIGNPPYVNTKQISSMGQTKKLSEEYGYTDDLYNHFTIRGLELVKSGGLLSYITSDTFLTLQSKKNMRREFLGIPLITKTGDGLFANEKKTLPECRVMEIINTPKAFAALVDTAIFSLKKEEAQDNAAMVYVDLRKPNAKSFEITEEQWQQIKTSKENISGWERVLEHTFSALGYKQADWILSHTCDGDKVFKDQNSSLLKFKLSFEPYRKAINYAIFSPTTYNCQILEKIVKPARPIFDSWWDKIETSRNIEQNRKEIKYYTTKLKPDDITMIGLLTDGGQGLATGNNGRFVGYKKGTRLEDRCKVTRVEKLHNVILDKPEIKNKWKLFKYVETKQDVEDILNSITEQEIWKIFDEIKAEFGLRVFGKGYMYRIIPNNLEYNTSNISDEEKLNGISGAKCWVPYDKGDKEGNRWYLETPYLIDWSSVSVDWLKSHSGHSGAGMPVVRNPQFYFRHGFCWTNVLNPNSSYIKCRLKDKSVNDVGSMSLYDELNLGDEYFVTSLNSFLFFKVLREFFNGSVNVQMNDIRKLPIKIPSATELNAFKAKFDECLDIQQQYFNGDLEKAEARKLLKPIELEIDEMVNKLYGITAEVEEIEETEDKEDEV
jgi:Spy/CpxP family protein refolding chaperone